MFVHGVWLSSLHFDSQASAMFSFSSYMLFDYCSLFCGCCLYCIFFCIVVQLAQRTLRWYGHLLRMPPDTPTRTIFDFDPVLHGGKRPRGRPPTGWKDTTGAFLVMADIQEDVHILARDRSKWRHHVASLLTPEAFQQEH